MPRTTKPIQNAETSVERLSNTVFPHGARGLDVDFITHTDEGWIVFEYLRCVTVPAVESHPCRYWFRNWRKFCQLWSMAQQLDARFILVNYEEPAEGVFGFFRVMEVDMQQEPSQQQSVITADLIPEGTLEDFVAFAQQLDQQATLAIGGCESSN